MNKFDIDVKEIISFIVATIHEQSLSFEFCLNQITTNIDDEFLMDRACFIKKNVTLSEDLVLALQKLSSICNEEKHDCKQCPIKKYCNAYIKFVRGKNKDGFKMVDLFCGAGGLSLGFTQEGFVTVLANDIQDCCIDTYAHNHPETDRKNIVLGDIKQLVENIDKFELSDVDIIVGGPPCQGFSMANRQRIIDDPRNELYKYYVECVRKLAPKFFVMENVKGMMSVANQVVEDFNTIGYAVSYRIFNAKDFGVPQNRERLIYIGNRLNIDNDKIMDKIVNYSLKCRKSILSDALFGLRPLKALNKKNATEIENNDSGRIIDVKYSEDINWYIDMINHGEKVKYVLNHKARYNNERDIEIYGRLNQGDRSDDPKIADIMPYSRRNGIFKDKYYKLRNDSVCKTITAHMKFDCNMYIHPTQARGLTPREAARVQTYPDDYYFRGAYTKTYMQIGNSVPPILGNVIAKIIKVCLEDSKNGI